MTPAPRVFGTRINPRASIRANEYERNDARSQRDCGVAHISRELPCLLIRSSTGPLLHVPTAWRGCGARRRVSDIGTGSAYRSPGPQQLRGSRDGVALSARRQTTPTISGAHAGLFSARRPPDSAGGSAWFRSSYTTAGVLLVYTLGHGGDLQPIGVTQAPSQDGGLGARED